MSTSYAAARCTSLLVWARAAALALVAVTTGAVSHVTADGRLPHPLALLALLGVAVLGSAAFLRARASALRLVVMVVGGQTLTHVALTALAGHGSTAVAGSGGAPLPAADGRRVGSLMDQYDAVRAPASGEPDGAGGGLAGHLVAHVVDQGLPMVLAHTLAAVVLALWLAVGETALWRLLELGAARWHTALRAHQVLRAAVAAVRGAVATALPRPHPPVTHQPPPRQLVCRVVSHRGPPVLLAA